MKEDLGASAKEDLGFYEVLYFMYAINLQANASYLSWFLY